MHVKSCNKHQGQLDLQSQESPTPHHVNTKSLQRPITIEAGPLNKRQWRERGSLRYTRASLISCTWYFHISAFQYSRMSGLLDLWISAFLDFRSYGLCNVLNISRFCFSGFRNFWVYDFLDFLCSQRVDNLQISSSNTFPNQNKSKMQVLWTLTLSSNVKLGIAALRLIRNYWFRKCRISQDWHRMSFELLRLCLHILEYRRLRLFSFKKLQSSDLVGCKYVWGSCET